MEQNYYPIHKGLQKDVLYMGLRAKYIYYCLYSSIAIILGGLLLSAFLPMVWAITLMVISIAGIFLALLIYSRTYGAHGFIKKMADRKLPKSLKQSTPFKSLLLWENL